MDDKINKKLESKLISEDLILNKVQVPLGIILVIFESRPDAFPQIVSLSLKTGNGLFIKGGKESIKSITILNDILLSILRR